MPPSPDVVALLPLKPVEFQVLLALGAGPRHGYAILKEIESATGGEVKLNVSTLYGVLHRLESRGLLEEAADVAPGAGGSERRRCFQLTRFGRSVGRAEAERLADVLSLARNRRFLPSDA